MNYHKEVFMKYTQGQYIITEKHAIAREIYSFTISCPEVKGKDHPCRGVHQQNDVLGHIV